MVLAAAAVSDGRGVGYLVNRSPLVIRECLVCGIGAAPVSHLYQAVCPAHRVIVLCAYVFWVECFASLIVISSFLAMSRPGWDTLLLVCWCWCCYCCSCCAVQGAHPSCGGRERTYTSTTLSRRPTYQPTNQPTDRKDRFPRTSRVSPSPPRLPAPGCSFEFCFWSPFGCLVFGRTVSVFMYSSSTSSLARVCVFACERVSSTIHELVRVEYRVHYQYVNGECQHLVLQ